MARLEPEISREALFEKLGYEYHSEIQEEMHLNEARFRVAACGRRFGKSTWAGHEMTYRMFVPDSIHWIVGPNYRLGEKEFRIVLFDIKKLGLTKRCSIQNNINQGNMRIHFKDLNSIVEVVSAEKPDGLVGEGLDSVIMSEAAKHKMSTWQMYIEPALSDKRGCADFPSTPQGYNWFKGLYDLGQMGLEGQYAYEEYASWRAPTWMNKKMFPGGIDDKELKRIKSTVSKQYWDQEYSALFTSFEGMIYDEFNPDVHVKTVEYNPFWRNYWTLDFGYTDPFVCLDIMVDSEDRVYVWREYQVRGKSTSDHGLVLTNRDNPEGFHVNAIFADPRGADQISTLTPILGGIAATPVGWDAGIECVKRLLKIRPDGLPGLIIDRSCTEFIRQMQQLRKKMIKEGQNERAGQHDYDDHGPDAFRYFCNHFFVLGAGSSLRDVYDTPNSSEAAGFFTYTTGMRLDEGASFFRQ